MKKKKIIRRWTTTNGCIVYATTTTTRRMWKSHLNYASTRHRLSGWTRKSMRIMSKHLKCWPASKTTTTTPKRTYENKKMCNFFFVVWQRLLWKSCSLCTAIIALNTCAQNSSLPSSSLLLLVCVCVCVFPHLFIQCDCWSDQHLMNHTHQYIQHIRYSHTHTHSLYCN